MFFMPFLFTIRTRYNAPSKIAVYGITYIVPLFLIAFMQNYPASVSDATFYVVFLLALVSYVNLYEVGYIWNECETIKKETDPTKRLSDEQLAFYDNHKILIYTERFVLSAGLNAMLSCFVSALSLLLFSAMEILSCAVFFVYNSVRGKYTQVIYLFLSILKYSALCFCFSEMLSFSTILASIFVFPLVRTMEYKAHYGTDSNVNRFFRKYIIRYDISRITSFRVLATLALLCISVALRIFGMCNWIPAIACTYMFLYRLMLFVAVKAGVQFKEYLKR